jgi:hypothetical protein
MERAMLPQLKNNEFKDAKSGESSEERKYQSSVL